MKQIIETLESIWLNEKEVKIYLTSLTLWQSSASILWKKSSIIRSTAQYTCNSLVEKRLLNKVEKWNTLLYSPEPPEKIISFVNKEYVSVEKKMQNVQSIMWYLNTLANPNAKLPKVKYYSWVEWIIDILEDIFTEKKEFYWVFSYVEDIHPDLNNYIQNIYVPKRIKTKIPSKFLFNNNQSSQEYMKNNEKMNRITMSIPKDVFPFSIWIHIYSENKVALYSMSRDDMTGIIIENENITSSLMSMFQLAWNFAKTLPENN